MSEVVILQDAQAVAEAAAELFVEAAGGAVAARGRALVALTGGSSAPPLFAALRSERWRGRLPWERLDFFFTDERAVPPDDELSNHRVAREGLFAPLAVQEARVHRMRGEEADREAEARRYADELRAVTAGSHAPSNGSPYLVARPSQGPPRFDLVLLGLGPDGHVCSLFAGTDEAVERGDQLLVRAVSAPLHLEPRVPRLTLTPSPLLLARNVLLMTSGAKKAEVLARTLKGPEDLRGCPAQWLRRASGRVVVACDEAAGVHL
jgi:6-phosphogluconolactonase